MKPESETSFPPPLWAMPIAMIGGLALAAGASSDLTQVTTKTLNGPATEVRRKQGLSDRTGPLQHYESYLAGWKTSSSSPDWHFDLASRLDELSGKEDGWKGENSEKAKPGSLEFARILLWKLAQEGIDRKPSVGLDYEGTFSFMWMYEDIKADLTVYEDGTYSFFAKNKDTVAMADDDRVDDPIDGKLLGILLS